MCTSVSHTSQGWCGGSVAFWGPCRFQLSLLASISGIWCGLSHGLKWSCRDLMHLPNSRMDTSWMLHTPFYFISCWQELRHMATPGQTGGWELKPYYRKCAQLKISGSISVEDIENEYWRTTGSLCHRHPIKHFRKELSSLEFLTLCVCVVMK